MTEVALDLKALIEHYGDLNNTYSKGLEALKKVHNDVLKPCIDNFDDSLADTIKAYVESKFDGDVEETLNLIDTLIQYMKAEKNIPGLSINVGTDSETDVIFKDFEDAQDQYDRYVEYIKQSQEEYGRPAWFARDVEQKQEAYDKKKRELELIENDGQYERGGSAEYDFSSMRRDLNWSENSHAENLTIDNFLERYSAAKRKILKSSDDKVFIRTAEKQYGENLTERFTTAKLDIEFFQSTSSDYLSKKAEVEEVQGELQTYLDEQERREKAQSYIDNFDEIALAEGVRERAIAFFCQSPEALEVLNELNDDFPKEISLIPQQKQALQDLKDRVAKFHKKISDRSASFRNLPGERYLNLGAQIEFSVARDQEVTNAQKVAILCDVISQGVEKSVELLTASIDHVTINDVVDAGGFDQYAFNVLETSTEEKVAEPEAETVSEPETQQPKEPRSGQTMFERSYRASSGVRDEFTKRLGSTDLLNRGARRTSATVAVRPDANNVNAAVERLEIEDKSARNYSQNWDSEFSKFVDNNVVEKSNFIERLKTIIRYARNGHSRSRISDALRQLSA